MCPEYYLYKACPSSVFLSQLWMKKMLFLGRPFQYSGFNLLKKKKIEYITKYFISEHLFYKCLTFFTTAIKIKICTFFDSKTVSNKVLISWFAQTASSFIKLSKASGLEDYLCFAKVSELNIITKAFLLLLATIQTCYQFLLKCLPRFIFPTLLLL